MPSLGTLTLTGASGKGYKFKVYKRGTSFKAVGAVYYVSKRTEKRDGTGSHSRVYVGETDDLSDRFEDHHKEDCFDEHDANAISVHRESDEETRREIEADLVAALDPPCND